MAFWPHNDVQAVAPSSFGRPCALAGSSGASPLTWPAAARRHADRQERPACRGQPRSLSAALTRFSPNAASRRRHQPTSQLAPRSRQSSAGARFAVRQNNRCHARSRRPHPMRGRIGLSTCHVPLVIGGSAKGLSSSRWDSRGSGCRPTATTRTARKLSWHRVVSVRPTRRSFSCLPTL